MQKLGKLGIQASLRIVDPAQYKSRTEDSDFDIVAGRLPVRPRRASNCAIVFTSEAAKQNGSRNLAGVADPVVDALIERSPGRNREKNSIRRTRALDRVLRAGQYWVPKYYRDKAWVAYWDAFPRPERQPKLGAGAPDTWWWVEERQEDWALTTPPLRGNWHCRSADGVPPFDAPLAPLATPVPPRLPTQFPCSPISSADSSDDSDDFRHHGGVFAIVSSCRADPSNGDRPMQGPVQGSTARIVGGGGQIGAGDGACRRRIFALSRLAGARSN